MTEIVFQIKDAAGLAVDGASVLVAYPDGRYLTGKSDTHGKCRLDLYRTDLHMKILVAAEDFEPSHDTFLPGRQQCIPVELVPSTKERKALLFTRSTGYIPGVSGTLNPHKDGYVYGDNIAIDGRLARPAAHFEIGKPLHLVDVYGVETTIRFLVVEGQFSLIEYTIPKSYGGE